MEIERNIAVPSLITAKERRPFFARRWFATGQAYLYLLPVFIILAAFAYLPAIFVFYMSLFKWNFLNQGSQPFVGLSNYQFLLHDPNFWQSLQVTLTYVVISVPLQLFLSLFLALILMSGIRAKAFWRLAIFAPFITPMVATTIWYWMFDNYHGFFNAILHLFHQRPIDWLGDPRWTLVSIIFYTTWKSVGFSTVLFMAGLTNLSPSLGEAARVDEASAWQSFRHITWPLIMLPLCRERGICLCASRRSVVRRCRAIIASILRARSDLNPPVPASLRRRIPRGISAVTSSRTTLPVC
ncbi:MAG: sugar ABC transporter permease [Chloroflexota bacterium]|nr:sugar ABC transporter permease [Chloroflexota bacterium]